MTATLRIHADENMPGMDAFACFGTVTPFAGRALRAADLAATDVLLVRSVTRVDATLLAGTPVRFVGSATIGTDHVDQAWLAAHDVAFAHAPGCNAMAVVEYVLQAVLSWCQRQDRSPEGMTLGVVGAGNVGSRLAAVATALGMRVRVCDPPRQAGDDPSTADFVTLDAALACEVVSLHVPLVEAGNDATRHLLGPRQLAALHAGQLLLNTSRGPVIDNNALLARLQQADAPTCVLDVWEGEPHVPRALAKRVWLGSPHIAGYSHEGKLRGSWMLHAALAAWRNTHVVAPTMSPLGQRQWAGRDWRDVLALLRENYRIEEDHRRLLASLEESDPARAFDRLRKTYPLRHELSAWRWNASADCGNAPLRQRLLGA